MQNKSHITLHQLGACLIVLGMVTIVSLSLLYIFCVGYVFYNNLFRLTSRQVSDSLNGVVSTCNSIIQCQLEPGDILVRRNITDRTRVMDKFAHLYFTHVAFYMGNDQLIEAGGIEKDSRDDIKTVALSKSDWVANDIQSFIILRPKKYGKKIDVVRNELMRIANDPEYSFGFPWQGYKKTTCADLVFVQLLNEGVIDSATTVPQPTTPDYFFSYAIHNPGEFGVVGFNVR